MSAQRHSNGQLNASFPVLSAVAVGDDAHSKARQARYLADMNRMSPACQAALAGIFQLAMSPEGGGSHVLQAYIESAKHPIIYRFSMENIIMRFQLAQAKRQHNAAKEADLSVRLEDFHIAVEAFVLGNSLDVTAQNRASRKAHPPCQVVPLAEYPQFTQTLEKESVSVSQFIETCRRVVTHLKRRSDLYAA